MNEDLKKMNAFGVKLKLKNMFEENEAIKATQTLLKICKENGFDLIASGVYSIQQKIMYGEVEHNG